MPKITDNNTEEQLDKHYCDDQEACANCGHIISNGETICIGCLKDRTPAVLCDKCAILLDETVVRYYWQKQPYSRPEPNDKLWRYMDISKFISMLVTKSLYFAPATSFEDPFEGAKGIATRKDKWDSYYLNFFRYAIKTAPGISEEDCSDENLEKTAQRLLREIESSGADDRNSVCISCWHCNEYESEAMWKLYSKNVANAIAIETTYEKLYRALGEKPYIEIGKVKYIDYKKQFTNIGMGAFWYKRKSFEHEREVRAVFRKFEVNGSGISIPVDLDLLIDRVYVSPYAPEWFAEVVRDIVEKYNLNKPVLHSSMNEQPFY